MIPIELSLPVFIAGVILLYKCSDILVEGTAKTAAGLGVSSLIISLIIVAFGTSAPEFAISFGAALQGNQDIATGNIIGSCIANLLLVIGLSAVIRPITIQKKIIHREIPILLLTTIVLLVFSSLQLLDTYHYLGGILFLFFFILFLIYFIRIAKKERIKTQKYQPGKLPKNSLYIILGISGVVLGAYLLIESAICIADFLNIPTFIIALSMVAIGTSLPELVVSAMAAYKNESDIAIGNIIGSNIFNILLILGAAALLIPLNANATETILNIIYLLIITIIMLPILKTGHKISRPEGVLLLILYAGFIGFIFYI